MSEQWTNETVEEPNQRGERRARFPWFVMVACVATTVAALAWAARFVVSLVVSPKAGKLEVASFANVSGAHFTITNLSNWTRYGCVRGILTAKISHKRLESIAVCTGNLAPRSTITLDAPFNGGTPQEVCTTSNGETFAWDACEFEPLNVNPDAE